MKYMKQWMSSVDQKQNKNEQMFGLIKEYSLHIE